MAAELIDNIRNLEDQIASQFQLIFPQGLPGKGKTNGADDSLIGFRLSGAIEPPDVNVATYDVYYRGIKIVKTSMQDGTDKTVSMELRVDQNWINYSYLQEWLDIVFDRNNATRYSELATKTEGRIVAYDGQNNIKKQFVYTGLKIKSLKVSAFDNNGTDPSKVTATFVFDKFTSE